MHLSFKLAALLVIAGVLININSFSNNITPINITQKGSLSGTVKDATTQAPLAKATISFPDLKLSFSSNDNGAYHIQSLPNGTFTVEVSHIGYRSFIGQLTINNTTVKDFVLQQTVVENEHVTVTGVSSSTNLKTTPYHISIINQRQLNQSAGTNLLDAVAMQPGVSIVTTGPAIAKPFIRGLGYNRVVTINDGIRQEGQQWGDEHGIEIDEYSTQKIELLRGASSLMYGSDAIGGVLNIQTHTPVESNTVKANITTGFNSNNKMYGAMANVTGNINGFNWNAYGSLKNAGDYKNKFDGTVLNSRFNEKNFGGLLGLNRSWGFTHLLFSNFDQTIGMIEGERDANGNLVLESNTPSAYKRKPLVPYQQVQHFKTALDNSFSLNNGSRITATLAFQRNQRREFGDVANPNTPEAFFDLKTLSYNMAYHLPVVEDWKTTIGVAGMSQTNTNRAEEAIIPNYNLFDFGLYTFSHKKINKTNISGGLRFDTRSLNNKAMMDEGNLKFAALKKTFSNFSGSAGIAQELSGAVIFKANIAKGFRAPNQAELSSNGAHEGTNRYEIGNPNLKSENSFSVDAGLEVNTLHVSLNIAPYFNHISNYIFYQKLLANAGGDSIIDNNIVFKYGQQSARLYGLEMNFDIHPHPLDWLHFENSFSFTRGRFTKPVDGSYNLPLIAPARLLTDIRAEFPNQLSALKNAYIKFEIDNNWAQTNFFSGYETETATKAYTLLNAGIGSDIFIAKKRIASLFISVNNITDAAYQNHLSRLKYLDENVITKRNGVFNMGRNFSARLIIPFEWRIAR